MSEGDHIVELACLQPMEAEVLVARLRAAGIAATAGAPGVPYGSLGFAGGVSVWVAAKDVARASSMVEP